MSCFGFMAPSDWANYRNIDQEINFDELNAQFIDENDEGSDDGAKKPQDENK